MFKKFKESKYANPGTILTVTSLVILLLTTNGVEVDSERIMTTVKILCSLGVVLGALNNPETPGLDLPFAKKK